MTTDNPTPPVLTQWDEYEFPEESLPPGKPRLSVRDPLPGVSVGDLPPLEAVDPGGRRTADALIELVSGANPEVDSINYHGDATRRDPVRWLTVSPFDVYLERVFAEKLCEVE
ncbi:MAG: hypothetical protein U0324_36915 [Polyangiales bacterium]